MFDANKYNPANLGFQGKMKPQSNGGRKNTPSQSEEQGGAWAENMLLDAANAHRRSLVPTDPLNTHPFENMVSINTKEQP